MAGSCDILGMFSRDDLSRRYFLDVTASGHVFIRERGQPLTPGGLPTFTTETHDDALMLQQRHCRRANDGTGFYQLNDWGSAEAAELDALDRTQEMFRHTYETVLVRKAAG